MGIFERPTLRNAKKKDIPNDLWTKCPECGTLLHTLDLKQNNQVCTHCEHHFMLGSRERIATIADPESFQETDASLYSKNPLGFDNYEKKIDMLRDKTDLNDAVVTGRITVEGSPARGMIIVSASSGARMQEGMLSLMQMAKTCGALAKLSEHGLPYISLLTHPTTGGVTASFATIGDINLAEPKCMIGFAGPRVVKETTHQDLPPGFQTAEFMLEHGLIDAIVKRQNVRKKIAQLLRYMLPA